MDALILAAGRGTRMENLEVPKCLIDIGGIKIIDYQLSCLKQAGIENIFVVTGYNSEMISNHLKDKVIFLHNSNYAFTNNLHSLWIANGIIKNDFVCIYSDLFFHEEILKNCINSNNEICLVIEKNIRDETMRVRIENKSIIEVNKKIPKDDASGNFIGMAKFKKNSFDIFFGEMEKMISTDSQNLYYTSVIESIIKKGQKVGYVTTENFPWIDMDEKHEVEQAKRIYQKIVEEDS